MSQVRSSTSILDESSEQTYGSTETCNDAANMKLKQELVSPDEVDVDILSDNISDLVSDGDVSKDLKNKLTLRLTAAMAIVVSVGILAIVIGLFVIYPEYRFVYPVGVLLITSLLAHICYGTILLVIARSKVTSMESLGFSKPSKELSTSAYKKSDSTHSSDFEVHKSRDQLLSPHEAKSPDFAFVYVVSYIKLFFAIISIISSCLGIALSVAAYSNLDCEHCGVPMALVIIANLLVGIPTIVVTVLSIVNYLSLNYFINSKAFKQLELRYFPNKTPQ